MHQRLAGPSRARVPAESAHPHHSASASPVRWAGTNSRVLPIPRQRPHVDPILRWGAHRPRNRPPIHRLACWTRHRLHPLFGSPPPSTGADPVPGGLRSPHRLCPLKDAGRSCSQRTRGEALVGLRHQWQGRARVTPLAASLTPTLAALAARLAGRASGRRRLPARMASCPQGACPFVLPSQDQRHLLAQGFDFRSQGSDFGLQVGHAFCSVHAPILPACATLPEELPIGHKSP